MAAKPTTTPTATAPENGGIHIKKSVLVGTFISILVVAVGWGAWGWVQDSVGKNPKVNDIITNQKALQKETRLLSESVIRMETKMNLKFEEYDKFFARLEAELRRSNGTGVGGGNE